MLAAKCMTVSIVVLAQHARDQLAVADVADDQRRIAHRLAKAGGEIVEHDHPLAALAQLQRTWLPM